MDVRTDSFRRRRSDYQARRRVWLLLAVVLQTLLTRPVFSGAGTPDLAFAASLRSGFNDAVLALAIQTDGKIVVGGAFTALNGDRANGIARLNADGSADTAFTFNTGTGFNAPVKTLAVQADGKIVVGGSFTPLNGVTNALSRLNADGTLDLAFNANISGRFTAPVDAVLVQPDGRIVVGGQFLGATGIGARLTRLNADGSVDTAFTANLGSGIDDLVGAIALQPDGKLVIGGGFTTLNGVAHNHMARLNADGTPDTSFTANVGTGHITFVETMALQTDGKIVVGGNFTVANGGSPGVARLNADGSRDTAFTTNLASGFNNDVVALAIQSDGSIVLVGTFTSAVFTNGIARLDATGAKDLSFSSDLGSGFDNTGFAYAVATQTDGKIVVGGDFRSVDGVAIAGVMRLGTDYRIFPLTVVPSAPTLSDVSVDPFGVICASPCTGIYKEGTAVTLTAHDTLGKFVSWGPGGCGTSPVCTVTMNAALTLSVTYVPSAILTFHTFGPGTVTSSPPGIACGTTCTGVFAKDSVVTLTATPDLSSRLMSWTTCPFGPTCQVTMSTDQTVSAFFLRLPPSITSVSPPIGTTPGGTVVTLHGAAFTPQANVTIGEADAFNVVVSADQSTITAVAPPLSAGVKSITVRGSDGQTATLNAAFTVVTATDPNPDLDHNGVVDIFDATILTSCFGVTPQPGTQCGQADLDRSGAVDTADLAILRDAYGQSGIATTGTMTARGASSSTFNPVGATIWFDVTGGSLAPDDGLIVMLNDDSVDDANVHVTATSIEVDNALVEGRNHFEVIASGATGQDFQFEGTFWAGTNTLNGVLTGEPTPLFGATATATVGDDEEDFSLTLATTAFGTFQFTNVPSQSVALTLRTSDNRIASTAVRGTVGNISLSAAAVLPPSPIDNNDLSQGTAGWTGDGVITIVPHVEGSASTSAPSPVDNDIQVTTSGVGPRHLHRAFTVKPGTSSVSVRYRFKTAEVPNGFFGSQFDDFYAVTLTTQKAGVSVTDTNSMNLLGLLTFDSIGEIAWRELTLPVTQNQEVVQLDVTVANVADALYDSSIIIDRIPEQQVRISNAKLFDIDNLPLKYLSASPHAHCAPGSEFCTAVAGGEPTGETRIDGQITIEGAQGDSLADLSLQVLAHGDIVATGHLTDAMAAILLQPFGASGQLQVTHADWLFRLTPDQLSGIPHSEDGWVEFRIVARTALGGVAEFPVKKVRVLTSVMADGQLPRFGLSRDEDRGGDDWARPSLSRFAHDFPTFKWNDFSNLNAGSFHPDHKSHDKGIDADGQFADWVNAVDPINGCWATVDQDVTMANRFLDMLNDIVHGQEIKQIWITCKDMSNPFWTTFNGKTVLGNRNPKKIVRPLKNHHDHFHVRLNKAG